MQKTSIVQEIIGKAVEPNGFEYLAYNAGSWTFQKSVGELKQSIIIRLMSKGKLKLYFSTNVYGQKSIYGETLVKEGEDRGHESLGYFTFEGEHEFVRTIEYFKKIILDYGIAALEKASVPTTEIRPTKESNLHLFQNHEELNIKFRQKLCIDDSTSDNDIFRVAQDCLLQTHGQDFVSMSETLIGLAAIVGNVIVNVSDGDWEWDSINDICWVVKKEIYPKKIYPLSIIISCWRGKPEHTFTILSNNYSYMKTKN